MGDQEPAAPQQGVVRQAIEENVEQNLVAAPLPAENAQQLDQG